ncbi:MAG: tRNA (guanosine(46)-N7)-methyltransferase TrmB [Phycisphaerales bacterium]|nr:tRNA (guanosine(46)-N7)-methyltransferase TrmB [Phycisphaerales bacterium]
MPKFDLSLAISSEPLTDFSWADVFGEERAALPVELEIGTGKGAFLLRRALALPDRNFLGIEWANEFYRYAADRMARRGATNVRMLRAEASLFMRQTCPRDSLAALHVYHPDPWPKKRHHKRRLFQLAFVEAAISCLKSGARWAIQTDHAEYFAQIRSLLMGHSQLIEAPFDDPAWSVDGARLGTNFEVKYIAEGRPIHQIAFTRR